MDLANFVSCNYAKPNSDFNKNRPWSCKGDGDLRKETVFVAQPGDLNLLFDGLRYENSVKNSKDNVTIKIYDGVNGDMGCVPKDEQNVDGSIRGNGCYFTNLTLSIEVGGFDPLKDDGKGEQGGFLPFGIILPYQAMLGLMGGMLVFVCCCCSCMKRRWKKRTKRKREERKQRKGQKKADKMVQLPEIAGKDLEHGVRDNRAKNAGAGFRNIAGKGVKGVKGGLEKAQGYGVGGPAVSLAMKGVKMAERRLEEKAGGGGEEGTNPTRTGSGGADIPPPQPAKEPRLRPPPPPLRTKASSIFKC